MSKSRRIIPEKTADFRYAFPILHLPGEVVKRSKHPERPDTPTRIYSATLKAANCMPAELLGFCLRSIFSVSAYLSSPPPLLVTGVSGSFLRCSSHV